MRLSKRDARLDGLRGLLLVIMTGVHVPSPLSHWLQEPFGFTSAAEGFLFLGAVLAGRVYGAIYGESGFAVMARRVWDRARRVYAVHLLVLTIALFVAWHFAGSLPPLADQFHDSVARPAESMALTPLLLHQPPLFDILPLYVVFLWGTPWLLAMARRHGWLWVLAVSAFAWLTAQLEARRLGDFSAVVHLRLGSFNILAWQFLWVAGLALGETMLRGALARRGRTGIFAAFAGVIV
ncbi:MAG TPA: OpgC domain-containing protein, partial [Verrucomicrobiae bacterium]|nr:OpgC domain-containing protein [Verrucomicrobiae bacterium]